MALQSVYRFAVNMAMFGDINTDEFTYGFFFCLQNEMLCTKHIIEVFFLLPREQFYGCHQWSRNCLPFRSTCVHSRFLVGFVLLYLQFYMYVLQISVCPFGHCVVCSFFDIRILIVIFKLFLLYCCLVRNSALAVGSGTIPHQATPQENSSLR